jgi:hypothetical protein
MASCIGLKPVKAWLVKAERTFSSLLALLSNKFFVLLSLPVTGFAVSEGVDNAGNFGTTGTEELPVAAVFAPGNFGAVVLNRFAGDKAPASPFTGNTGLCTCPAMVFSGLVGISAFRGMARLAAPAGLVNLEVKEAVFRPGNLFLNARRLSARLIFLGGKLGNVGTIKRDTLCSYLSAQLSESFKKNGVKFFL